MIRPTLYFLTVAFLLTTQICRAEKFKEKRQSMSEIIAASAPEDWRPLNPESTLYLDLRSGRVVIELAPQFAPNHVENVKLLAR